MIPAKRFRAVAREVGYTFESEKALRGAGDILGRVTRARITQIMKLLDLAPDIQEQILFLPSRKGLNERNPRPIVSRIDWNEQRPMFQKIVDGLDWVGDSPDSFLKPFPLSALPLPPY
jgi:hypothetical protein